MKWHTFPPIYSSAECKGCGIMFPCMCKCAAFLSSECYYLIRRCKSWLKEDQFGFSAVSITYFFPNYYLNHMSFFCPIYCPKKQLNCTWTTPRPPGGLQTSLLLMEMQFHLSSHRKALWRICMYLAKKHCLLLSGTTPNLTGKWDGCVPTTHFQRVSYVQVEEIDVVKTNF